MDDDFAEDLKRVSESVARDLARRKMHPNDPILKAIDAMSSASSWLSVTFDHDYHGIQAELDAARTGLETLWQQREAAGDVRDHLREYFEEKLRAYKDGQVSTEVHKTQAVLDLCHRMGLADLRAELEARRCEAVKVAAFYPEGETVVVEGIEEGTVVLTCAPYCGRGPACECDYRAVTFRITAQGAECFSCGRVLPISRCSLTDEDRLCWAAVESGCRACSSASVAGRDPFGNLSCAEHIAGEDPEVPKGGEDVGENGAAGDAEKRAEDAPPW